MLTKKTIVFGNKLDCEVLKCEEECFVETLQAVCCRLEIVPHWLMVVIDLETASTFDPSITNKLGYTGLIQFGKVAAAEVGTTTGQLRGMNACKQLEYVEKYLSRYKGKMKCLTDVYLAVFFPVAIGKHDGWTLETSRLDAARVARWNPGFDLDKNKAIQVWEIKKKLYKRLPKNFKWLKL